MDFTWRSESDTPAPAQLEPVDDTLTADLALKRARRGEFLLYQGDFNNARQLLSAMSRRLPDPAPSRTPLEAYRNERKARAMEHQTLGHLLVELDGSYGLALRRAPDVKLACTQAWGPPPPRTVVALKTLQGVLGAAEWRRKGLLVEGLTKPLSVHYGVYVPTRTDYLEAFDQLDGIEGTRCFDLGTGTGVLGLLLLARKAKSVIGTDTEPRAVACAEENAHRFKLGDRFTVEERSLFPDGKADLIVCNPPWIPEPPKTRLDRAVFDPGSEVLTGFLSGLRDHLTPKGRGALLLGNLAELLGLRAPDALSKLFDEHGLDVVSQHASAVKHPKTKDAADPLQAIRAQELTTLYVLKPRA